MSLGSRLLLAIALLGCESEPMSGPDGGPGFEPVCDGRCVYLVGALRVPREGAPVPGIDLDGRASDESDEAGCLKADFVAPDGREGVDNEFVELVPTLEAALGEDADEALREGIASGELLFLVELEDGGSSWLAHTGPAEATGELALGPSGELASGQTFAFAGVVRTAEATVGGAVVEASLGDVSVYFAFEGAATTLLVRDARLRVPFVEGLPTTGTLAGRLSVDDLLATTSDGPIDDPVRSTLEEQADLDPNPEGVCQSISIAFAVHLVPAQLAP